MKRFLKYGLFLAYCIFLATMPFVLSASTKITVIGDSISVGVGAANNYGYVQMLQDRYKAEGKDVIVYNRSYGGAYSDTLLMRGITTISTEQPDYIVIFLGTNEAVIKLPVKELKDNFFQMMARCSPNCKRVILCGVDTRLFNPSYNKHLVDLYTYLDHHFKPYPLMLLGTDIHPYCRDVFHPDDIGHELMAHKLYNALKDCGLSD